MAGERRPRVADRLAEESLDLIPRSIRDKLDRIGVKLHLKEWQASSIAERERLRDLPCATVGERARYAAAVEHLVRRITGNPPELLQTRPAGGHEKGRKDDR